MFLPVFSKYKKLPPTFIWPLELDSMVNHVSAHLKLPQNIEIHKVFHDSQFKFVFSSPLCPSVIDGQPAFSITWIIDFRHHGRGIHGRDTARLSPGVRRPQFWIKTWLGSSTAGIMTSLLGGQGRGVSWSLSPHWFLWVCFLSVSLVQLSLSPLSVFVCCCLCAWVRLGSHLWPDTPVAVTLLIPMILLAATT